MIKSALADNSARRLLIIKYLDIYNNSFTADYQQSIDIYTDGSLNASKVTADDAVIMGSGWYIPTLDISYGCASTGWPSSTKAELIAIWTAVLAVPSNFSHINIYTDSQAAIDGILMVGNLHGPFGNTQKHLMQQSLNKLSKLRQLKAKTYN